MTAQRDVDGTIATGLADRKDLWCQSDDTVEQPVRQRVD